jgi:hypothetical protein
MALVCSCIAQGILWFEIVASQLSAALTRAGLYMIGAVAAYDLWIH